jgi:ATP-dependent Clp protease ATP-binding subunit ClpC
VFERFTERARQAIVLAQDEARRLKHNYIGTEHILLGLLREDEGLAARVLAELGVGIEDVRAHVIAEVGEGHEHVASGRIPFTPRAKKVLELALRESLRLGHNYIGTEHMLLAVGRENSGVAMRILWDLGVGEENLREAVLGALNGEPLAPELHERRGREPGRRALFVPPRVPAFAGLFLVVGLAVGILVGWAIWG